MKFYYYFEDTGFEFEVDENQITDFLVDKWLEESKTPKNAETKRVVEHIIKQHSLWDDGDILDSYEDEMRDYFEEDARDCWEDSKDYEEDERDWFGTKANVIGL